MEKPLEHLIGLTEKTKLERKSRGAKKRFFLTHFNLILKAVELGNSYQDIIDAIKKEGVDFTYFYFAQLMAAEKNKRGLNGMMKTPQEQKTKQAKTESKRVAPSITTNPIDENLTQHEQDRLIYKEEVERIKNNSNMSSREKRIAMDEAQSRFAKNKTPLNIK